MSDSKNTFYCSFCGKSQHEVSKLIAGSTVFICDGCVEICVGIIGEHRGVSLDVIDEFGRVVFGYPLLAHLARPSDFGLNHDGSLIEGGAA